MRTLAVEPPPLLDKREKRLKFINRNGNIVICQRAVYHLKLVTVIS